LHPQYIYKRIAELKSDFMLRILLVLVDNTNNNNNKDHDTSTSSSSSSQQPLHDKSTNNNNTNGVLLQLNCLAVQHNLTLILAWSEAEAGRYLETYKAFDGKDASLIQRRERTHFADQVADVLCGGGGGINKTDAAQLLSQFQNVRSMAKASREELGLVPGMGQVKVKRLYDAFHKPTSSRVAAENKRR
jgi:DNA excision repair protein ERCC-1